jgi:hypothetical protein
MRAGPGLGLINLALVSAYFVPAWGHAALRVLISPYGGFEDRAHSLAAIYIRDLFDLGLSGLIHTSQMLAGLKMVIAAAFVAYLIEFARALAMRRQPDRAIVDVVLLSALVACALWIVPVLWLGDAALVRLQATEFLLLIGAAVIIVVERQIEQSAPMRTAEVPAQPVVPVDALAASGQAALVTLPAAQAALP